MTPGPDKVPPPAPIGEAIQDVTEKMQLLVREEIELAKAEVEVKVKSLLRGSVIGISAGVFVLVAMQLALTGCAWLAWYELFPRDQFFWGFFFMAAALLVAAGLAGYAASRLFKSGAPPVPKMAMEEAQLIRQTVTSSEPQEPRA